MGKDREKNGKMKISSLNIEKTPRVLSSMKCMNPVKCNMVLMWERKSKYLINTLRYIFPNPLPTDRKRTAYKR